MRYHKYGSIVCENDEAPLSSPPDDLLKDFLPEPEPEKTTKPEPAPVVEVPFMDYDETAEMYLGIMDAAVCMFGPSFYKSKRIAPDKREALEVLAEKVRSVKGPVLSVLEDDELPLYAQFKDYEAFLDALPMKDKEKKMMIKPLAKLLEKYKKQPGPESALMMAALLYLVPRAGNLYGVNFKL